jgi:multicomponent Na+:H+ antiporter subunit G
MDVRHVCALVLLVGGLAALLLAALALLVLPGPYQRLHALAPATTLGLPLVCLALAVDAGPSRAAVKLLVVAALVGVSGPVVTLAIGRTVREEGAASSMEEEPPA